MSIRRKNPDELRNELGITGGGGAFTDLTDVPSSYVGQTLKYVRVNAAETALEFATVAALTDGDKGDIIVSASGATFTVDADISKTWTGTHVFTTNQVIDSLEDADTTTVLYPTKLRRTTSGTAAAGLGVGEQFEAENGSGTNRVIGSIDAVYTDVTNTTESADLVLYKMGLGSLREGLRITIGGVTSNTRVYMQGLGVGGASPGTYAPLTGISARVADIQIGNASGGTSDVSLRVSKYTVTPTTGIGVGIDFATQTGAANAEIGAIIEAVTTDITAGSEDFDLVLKIMAAGAAAAEGLRLLSTKQLKLAGYTTTTSYTGTPVGHLQFDASGNILTMALSSAYTPTNVVTDRSYDANATSIDELADIVGTLIADLQAAKILG